MIGKNAGVVTKFREKVQAVSGEHEFWTFHCILHQEALFCKSLKLDHVMQMVVRTVNFIRTTTVSLTTFSVIRRFFYLLEEIENFMCK